MPFKKRKNDYFTSQGKKPVNKNVSHSKSKSLPANQEDQNAAIRLNRYISNSGICSRREADVLIRNGEISVNGKVITELGTKVFPKDTIRFRGKVILNEKTVYILLNKPKDYITTTNDPENRKTVMELVKGACRERIYPVGRLDRNTTGLLLLTNDGELTVKLSHPSFNVRKIYEVKIDKPINREDLQKIREGMMLEDGPITVDDIVVVTPDKRSLGIEIHSGRNRIVRRIFEQLGYKVLSLDRVLYANLTKKDLPRGKWRFLSKQETIMLKHLKIG